MQLQFGVKTANSFLQRSSKAGAWLVSGDESGLHQTRPAIHALGSVPRELNALLKKADPAVDFGGLERVQNKRREFL